MHRISLPLNGSILVGVKGRGSRLGLGLETKTLRPVKSSSAYYVVIGVADNTLNIQSLTRTAAVVPWVGQPIRCDTDYKRTVAYKIRSLTLLRFYESYLDSKHVMSLGLLPSVRWLEPSSVHFRIC